MPSRIVPCIGTLAEITNQKDRQLRNALAHMMALGDQRVPEDK